jgi:hypothetical protein
MTTSTRVVESAGIALPSVGVVDWSLSALVRLFSLFLARILIADVTAVSADITCPDRTSYPTAGNTASHQKPSRLPRAVEASRSAPKSAVR